MVKRREDDPEAVARDERYHVIRRCLSLIELYQEMMRSLLAAEAWDAELAKRMLSVRENCLLLVEHAMPVPTLVRALAEIETEEADAAA